MALAGYGCSVERLIHKTLTKAFGARLVMKRSVIVWVFLLASVSQAVGQTIIGEPILNFTLQDLNGNFHSPSQYRGKVLALYLVGHN